MCIGIPVQVIECDEHFARCVGRNGEERVALAFVGRQAPGVWLLSFLGTAREVMSAEHAAAVNNGLDALAAVQAGATDFSEFFADLDREPQLPDFLRTEKS